MFGFSFTKLVFTAVAIALVIYGFRWFTQMQQRAQKNSRNAKGTEKSRGRMGTTQDNVETMIQCKICNSYVAAGSPHYCDQEGDASRG